MFQTFSISARTRRCGRALILSAIAAAALSAFPPAACGQETPTRRRQSGYVASATGKQVRAAILRAIGAMKARQAPDGAWPDYAQEGGVTALVTYALLEAGVSPDDQALAAALEKIRQTPNRLTYVVSLKVLALSAADPKRYSDAIQGAADWFVQTQHATGGWGYGWSKDEAPDAGSLRKTRSEMELRQAYQRPDLSNTQFAVLALSEAQRAGARIPIEVWQKVDRHFRITQLPGGGWGYTYHDPDPEEAYGSMTAAAVASLYLTADRLALQEPSDAAADRQAAIERGVEWITRRYSISVNPGRDLAWYYFWLYSLERIGVVSGRRTFGPHDWFREGTALLVNGQRPDGSWTDRLYHDALCLLFLAKGYKPLLIQRLEWSGPPSGHGTPAVPGWRRDPRDLDHLIRFLGTRVGGDVVAWRTLDSGAPVADYLAAPILHITGRGPLEMSPATSSTLKTYVEQGGLILFDADGGDAAFTESVRRLAAGLFPESKFEPLAADHPVYRAVDRLAPAGLEALGLGCRAALLLAPRGLAEAWAAADPDRPDDALRLGRNLAVYATGNDTLPDRLSEATVLEMPPAQPPPRGALRIGQIQHDGDWQPRPYALPALLKTLADRFGVAVYSRTVPLRLTDEALGTFPVLTMTGHYTFRLSDAEREALKGYLDRGGFLWAVACCGRPAFDKAFRDLVAGLFPDSPLEELPPDHPIYSGKVGAPISTVAYSPAIKAESPDLARPVLYGLVRNGHLVIVYSPYGMAEGLDGIKTYGARAYAPDDARRLAVNILLYALTF